jgi:hypothetical protein
MPLKKAPSKTPTFFLLPLLSFPLPHNSYARGEGFLLLLMLV